VVCAIAASTGAAQAQSLDEAVNQQLEFVNFECERLLNGDPANVNALAGELAAICTRGAPAGGSTGSSSSAGGDAGTPASMPEAVRRRLEDDSTEEGPVRGFFLTLSSGVSDRDVTRFQDGYQSDTRGVLAGLDREFDAWVAGFTFEHFAQDGELQSGGNFKTTSDGFTLFGSRTLGDRANLDFFAGRNTLDNRRVRAARFVHLADDGGSFQDYSGLPVADFDAAQRLAGVQFAYRASMDNLSFGPRFALDWNETDFDAYTEVEEIDSGLALIFYGDERTSLVSTVGVDASLSISTDFGVIVLGQYLFLKHEHDDDQRVAEASFIGDTRNQRFQFQTEPPDRNYVEIGISAIFLFQGGLQAFLAYDETRSHSFHDTKILSGGIRKEF
jgi:uncharacterized protein YhjY with autotransporter beta-barrel domain